MMPKAMSLIPVMIMTISLQCVHSANEDLHLQCANCDGFPYLRYRVHPDLKPIFCSRKCVNDGLAKRGLGRFDNWTPCCICKHLYPDQTLHYIGEEMPFDKKFADFSGIKASSGMCTKCGELMEDSMALLPKLPKLSEIPQTRELVLFKGKRKRNRARADPAPESLYAEGEESHSEDVSENPFPDSQVSLYSYNGMQPGESPEKRLERCMRAAQQQVASMQNVIDYQGGQINSLQKQSRDSERKRRRMERELRDTQSQLAASRDMMVSMQESMKTMQQQIQKQQTRSNSSCTVM